MMVVLSRHSTGLIQHGMVPISSMVAAFSPGTLMEWALLEIFYQAVFSLSA